MCVVGSNMFELTAVQVSCEVLLCPSWCGIPASALWWCFCEDLCPTCDASLFIVSENGESYWRPDPWSRKQDGTPLGNSLTYFDEKFQWSDAGWSMPEWNKLVIYELHVGTFCAYLGWTGSATLDMCIQKLDYLVDLGINAIELLPVAEFDGSVDWGYTTATWLQVEIVHVN